ncbi:MAG TPA: beta-glucosidase BglX [Woeseiaceae bacterium]|nr:beta-glucosidase BglX [Woeseiaceae bacterium]
MSAAAVHASAPRRAVALAAAALAAVPAGSAFAQASPDDQAEAERFVADLMERMTLREKIGQLNLLTSSMDVTGPTLREGYRESVAAGDVGAIFNAYGADYTRSLQTLAVEETRLGIPLLFGYDVVHGFRTIFPIPLAEAASWDLEAIERSARVAATEAAAAGLHWTFAPMVDIARDPRWGRIAEGAGEDPWLGARIAAARVHGFQGDDLAGLDTVLACAKHFAAYGAAQAGRDYHTVDISLRTLWEVYLPPFEAAAGAGVATFMTAFNELNGVPATASRYLLTDVLQQHWGFEGFTVSDYTAVNELVPHGYARDEAHAAALALHAGVHMDMQGETFVTWLPELVRRGEVSEAAIDDAVRRILAMKYRLGLFDDPYRYSDAGREAAVTYADEHLEAARDVARRSLVLLKNDGVLPLADEDVSIALIGPLADSEEDMIGSWSAAGERRDRPVSVLEGVQERVGDDVTVHHAPGTSDMLGESGRQGFSAAIAAAARADVIVAVMGEPWDMTGEAASRATLDLPGAQPQLLMALHRLGKPIVLVLMSGRPLTIEWAHENVDAILMAWYPGTEGGHAVADVLFGDYNPSGKLPVTFPRAVGQVPIHYDVKPTGRPYDPQGPEQKYRSRYLDLPNTPLYPFGYGLSYTRFRYSDLALDRTELEPDDSLTVTVRVENTGDRDGEEIVQLYLRDEVASVTRPVRQLRGFRRVRLDAGAAETVEFELTVADLAFYRRDMSFGAEAGEFTVFVGGSSADTLGARFRLTADVSLRPPPPLPWPP